MARRPETPSPLKTGHLLRQLKELHFVGRGQEMSLLQDFAGAEGSAPPFFYLQGLPGIGKSALLDALRRWMETQPATYAYVDGRRLDTKTPEELLQHMAQALGLRHARPDLQAILSHLQALSRKKPAMLVIDSYDDLLPLDNWLREKFLAQLSLKVKVILAGRRPLPSPWTHSAGWRLLVKHHTLGPLQREEVAELLLRLQVKEDNPRLWWQHSHGHPLTLHLMIFAHLEGRLPDPARGLYDSRITLGLLENFWRDPISPRTKELLLAASWPFAFDRSLLETILEEPVSVDEFHELVQCPIVQREGKAWTLAEPFHTALRSYFLHHDPEKAHGCRKRLLEMEKRRVMEKALHED
ncbi:MAG: ATP-binding protein, partial [Bacillota bacterium]|nr:ATP-binding protein [Bacillota bacterium]